MRDGVRREFWCEFEAARLPGEQYSEPVGDPGLFGPGSAVWLVHADMSAIVGSLSGLMLGALHPRAMHCVHEHADYTANLPQRVGRTASFSYAVTYAAAPVAERMIEQVRGMHKRVRGATPDGRPYAADDPSLLTWVSATQALSIVRAHQRYHPDPLAGAGLDTYYNQYGLIARRLGATDVPCDRAAIDQYFQAARSQAQASDKTRAAAQFFRTPYGSDRSTRAASALIAQAAFDLLPDWAKQLYGVPSRSPRSALLVRPVTHALLSGLR
ncbi:oxygenase MpaB family protein [Streptomyces violascens]|uniref:oxygenase MpaB family protein n=1 Tax=Streptomyces violascens TaxID=67381 RepID=UPI003647D77F